ncbi:hypothetical protein CONPUDRAFT_137048 [Coniophora puteana RWD-64-598 SS2]|uniref:Uncharacterized protein n=1 Tax=Coniophora puteana (strain RWD-64-598) TaxID=741705 RepID=A0A5M3MQC3_CONPW|nr:uncharacterized protein CONPUDRAFT_137048 [Coniophora puteana RWD-64-598 SS2]EIW80914.1 hypothetical protein CONPUDRAFT_137048 [Coniophora puteana RWD-64-598 SS2]
MRAVETIGQSLVEIVFRHRREIMGYSTAKARTGENIPRVIAPARKAAMDDVNGNVLDMGACQRNILDQRGCWLPCQLAGPEKSCLCPRGQHKLSR